MIARSFVRCTESSSGWCFAMIELALANHDSWRWVQTGSVRWNPSFSFAVGINWIGNRTEFELETTFPRTVCQLLVPILWQGYRLLWRHAPKRSSLLNFEIKIKPETNHSKRAHTCLCDFCISISSPSSRSFLLLCTLQPFFAGRIPYLSVPGKDSHLDVFVWAIVGEAIMESSPPGVSFAQSGKVKFVIFFFSIERMNY